MISTQSEAHVQLLPDVNFCSSWFQPSVWNLLSSKLVGLLTYIWNTVLFPIATEYDTVPIVPNIFISGLKILTYKC